MPPQKKNKLGCILVKNTSWYLQLFSLPSLCLYMYPGCVLLSVVGDFLTQQVDVKRIPDLVMMGLVLLFSTVTLKLELLLYLTVKCRFLCWMENLNIPQIFCYTLGANSIIGRFYCAVPMYQALCILYLLSHYFSKPLM